MLAKVFRAPMPGVVVAVDSDDGLSDPLGAEVWYSGPGVAGSGFLKSSSGSVSGSGFFPPEGVSTIPDGAGCIGNDVDEP